MAVANGYDDMETQKRTMEAKLSAAAAEVNALRREHDRVIDKCTDLEIKMNQYSKLSVCAPPRPSSTTTLMTTPSYRSKCCGIYSGMTFFWWMEPDVGDAVERG